MQLNNSLIDCASEAWAKR